MSIIGYARVSTQDQDLSTQLAALKAAGANTIYREKISGVRADRPQLKKMVAALKRGDLVIVTRLDKLTVLGGLAEFERELIRQRTGEGRARALAAGVRFGRKPKLTDHQRKEAMSRRGNGETLAQIAQSYAVSVSMISRL
jgi:DNA invertase Pin-like site-specific DNA recombinase